MSYCNERADAARRRAVVRRAVDDRSRRNAGRGAL